ncbi:hypothetical protein B0J14DRAFT_562619 [Halenospora varia]|nr:hypothetical protein B0J14DRAFT_562619 [Halenospora varia]
MASPCATDNLSPLCSPSPEFGLGFEDRDGQYDLGIIRSASPSSDLVPGPLFGPTAPALSVLALCAELHGQLTEMETMGLGWHQLILSARAFARTLEDEVKQFLASIRDNAQQEQREAAPASAPGPEARTQPCTTCIGQKRKCTKPPGSVKNTGIQRCAECVVVGAAVCFVELG